MGCGPTDQGTQEASSRKREPKAKADLPWPSSFLWGFQVMPCIIIFYNKQGRIINQSYIDQFRLRDIEAELKLYRPKEAVRVVFDIALSPE